MKMKINWGMRKFVSSYGATGRRNFVLSMIVLLAGVVVGRVAYLQVYRAEFLGEQGDKFHVRDYKIKAERGKILDRSGVPLAMTTDVRNIWINPRQIKSEDDLTVLAGSLGLEEQRVIEKYRVNAQKRFVYIARNIPPFIAEQVQAQQLTGVYQERSDKRYYPSAAITSQIVGYTNIDDRGQEGLELMFDDWLAGVDGVSEVIRSGAGEIVEVLGEKAPVVQGQDLQLTIDKRIQYFTYYYLLEELEKTESKSASAIVLDAKTSEILAMVSVPSGNPNNSQERAASLIRNRVLTDTFEPGSVIKPFFIASALELGVIDPRTQVDTNPGTFPVGRNLVKDIHNYGKLDITGIIKKSSNVGMAKLALRTPKESVYATYRSVGLGKKSALGFPGEERGLLQTTKSLNDFEYVTTTFGYGLTTTLLQVAQAYSVIANDGLAIPATLFRQDSSIGERVMSKKTANSVRDMLFSVVGKGGTGRRAIIGEYIHDYTVAGKTGTTHKVVGGRYSNEKYRSLFAGMAPANDPDLVLVVMFDEPNKEKGYFGGVVAAPAFGKIMGKALRLRNIKPDKLLDADGSSEAGFVQTSRRP